jgi:hypothetical protein
VDPVRVTGPGGARLKRGDVLTGADVRTFVLSNGIARVTYELHVPGLTEAGACTLYRRESDAWWRVVGTQYGDWSYFGIGVAVTADRVIVVSANDEVAELALQWDAFDLSSFPGGGVILRDYGGNGCFPQSSALPRRISSTKLTKAIRMERGAEGYFLGWHSNPLVGPEDAFGQRNSTDWGEREFGTGFGCKVMFSSAGFSSHHPEWGSDARWAAAEASVGGPIQNRAAWPGIADPSYSIWSNPAVIATQNPGFPHLQTSGPWWVAEIPGPTVTQIPVCRYLSLVAPIEVGVWQFDPAQDGALVAHFCNEHRDARNVPYPYQVFFGAFPYTSPNLASEPLPSLSAEVARHVSRIVWPDSDPRAESPSVSAGTTSAGVRDLMRETIRALTPNVRSDARWRTHDERVDFRIWAEQNPTAAFRMFSIKTEGQLQPPVVSNTDVEWVETQFELVAAYPRDYRYGGGQHILDLDDVIESDLRQIEHAIGTNGYQSLEQVTGTEATVQTVDTIREPGIAAVFAVLRLRVMYWRVMGE